VGLPAAAGFRSVSRPCLRHDGHRCSAGLSVKWLCATGLKQAEPNTLPAAQLVDTRLAKGTTTRVLLLQGLQSAWRPVTFTVDAVALISRRSFHDPFRIRWQVGLGSGGSNSNGSAPQHRREVDVPYVATCGGTALPPAEGDLVSHATMVLEVHPGWCDT